MPPAIGKKQKLLYATIFLFGLDFQEALAGQRGKYFALGSTLINADIFILILSSTMPITSVFWWYHSLYPLAQEKINRIKNRRRYLDHDILDLSFIGDFEATETELQLQEIHTPFAQYFYFNQYLSVVRPLKRSALTVRVLSPNTNLIWTVAALISLNFLVFVLLYLANTIIRQHKSKQRQIERIRVESKQKLEFQVMGRTAELQEEIKVRAETESALRQTQEELIQAAKLAVLGKMSTSISEEKNKLWAEIHPLKRSRWVESETWQ